MHKRKLLLLLGCVVILAIAGPFIAIAADSSKPEQLVSPLDAASISSKNFMNYVSADGKVGNELQFGHQSQGLLIAAATSDRMRFDTIWKRTQDLQGSDKSYDASPADLLIAARAFLVAAKRLDDASYMNTAGQLGQTALRQLQAAPTIDSSTVQLRTIDELTRLSKEAAPEVAQKDRQFIEKLNGKLPANSNANDTTYGSAAQTIPLAIKDSCNAGDREVAQQMWRTLSKSRDARTANELNLDGSIKDKTPSVKATVATAAAAQVAGDQLQAIHLLDRSDELAKQQANVDAAAWNAIGRITVSTDWLGPC